MKDYNIIQNLSGANEYDRTKVGFSLFHELMGSDDSIQTIDELYIQKPIVKIFRDFNNLVMIDFVYEYPDDMDLSQQWQFLNRFFQPENSVNFNEEDLDRLQLDDLDEMIGKDEKKENKKILYIHTLTINIISLEPRGKYSMTTRDNPLSFNLIPAFPNEPSSILRMVFQKDDVVFEELDNETVKEYENSAIAEIEQEMLER